ncbi:hypothetical protein WKK05_27850 [Nostoc sp. UHCC 0302]|uniref:hypothetical protein n=1 Tax=Nostoc sp. UHCC 0302 TaxID=3134896 RepID=UPI00311CC19A
MSSYKHSLEKAIARLFNTEALIGYTTTESTVAQRMPQANTTMLKYPEPLNWAAFTLIG